MIRGTRELYSHFPWLKNYPQMSLYILKYGMDDLIQIPFVAENIERAEKTYKICNEKGISWREHLGIKKTDDDIVI